MPMPVSITWISTPPPAAALPPGLPPAWVNLIALLNRLLKMRVDLHAIGRDRDVVPGSEAQGQLLHSTVDRRRLGDDRLTGRTA